MARTRIEYEIWIPCAKCRGDGIWTVEQDIEEGNVELECPDCLGSGELKFGDIWAVD